MKKVNWLVVGIISIFVVLLLVGGGMMGGWGYHGRSMMGPSGIVGPGGMMDSWGYAPFGWVGMLFMWLIPIAVIVLAIFGAAWLVRNMGKPKPPQA